MLLTEMAAMDVDRVPVVADDDPTRIMGIISTSDVVGVETLLGGRFSSAE